MSELRENSLNTDMAVTALATLPAVACGSNLNLEILNNLKTNLTSDLSTITTATLSSINAQIRALMNGVSDLMGDLQLPEFTLQTDFINAMNILKTDISGFFTELAALELRYPSIDFDEILDKLKLGTLDLCTDVPNMCIVNGEELLKSLPALKPVETPLLLPDIPEALVPQPPVQALNSAIGVAIKSLNDMLKLSTDQIKSRLSSLPEMNVHTALTPEQIVASRTLSLSTMLTPSSEFSDLAANINAQAAAAASSLLNSAEQFNVSAAKLGVVVENQLSTILTEEKVSQIMTQLAPTADSLKLTGQTFAETIENINTKLSTYNGSTENIKIAKDSR